MKPEPFDIQTRATDNGVAHVRVTGELDMATVGTLRQRVFEIAAGARNVVIDLSSLSFVDSSGVKLLLELSADSARDGWELKLVPGSRHVQRPIQLMGVEDRLPFLQDGARAAAASEAPARQA